MPGDRPLTVVTPEVVHRFGGFVLGANLIGMGTSMGQDSSYRVDRYVLTESLGKGSQGTVYLAKDPTLDRFVAIKVLTANKAELRNQTHTGTPLEGVITGKLHHPSIVPIYDAGECEIGPYLVFEYVRGKTIAQVLKTNGPYTVADAVPLISAILQAMKTAHAAEIVHLDLSPRNILLDSRHTPRVMDFGLSQFANKLGEERSITAGTLRYMAPEHYLNTPLGAWSDVFALGSTFFEMIAGHHLMQGLSIDEIRKRIVSEPAKLDTLSRDPHGSAFIRFLDGALHKDPNGRYADCSVMHEAFELFVRETNLPSQVGATAGNHSTIEFLMRRMKRKKDFPTISSTLADINRLTANEAGASADQLANVILRDLALTSKLLKLVNSAFYGHRTSEISSISSAVVFLGVDTVRMTANSLTLFGHLRGDSAVLKDSMIKAFLSGLIARHLAQRDRMPDIEEAFICGMCQNLGENLAIYYFPDEFEEIAELRKTNRLDKHAASRGVLGVSYAELGAAVAATWSLPQSIVDAIKGRLPGPIHAPENDDEKLRDLAVFSNRLCDLFVDYAEETISDALADLIDAFSASVDLDYDYAFKVMNAGFEKLNQYSTVFELSVDKSAYCRSIRGWLGKELNRLAS